MIHTSVLLQESIDGLAITNGDVFLDCTINGGGHSEEVAKRFGQAVQIIGIDMDESALQRAEKRLLVQKAKFLLAQDNFRNVNKVLEKFGIQRANKILYDLGLSSNQFEDSGRGFSFQKDEPLLMTFKEKPTETDLTVKEILNSWDEENIADVIYGYGGETFSRRIAKGIVEARAVKPIETTGELVEIIKNATPAPYHRRKIHFATKTFQALRITANDEIRALKEGLEKGYAILAPKGRIAVISFHSIEDRIVKQFFKSKEKAEEAILITKKPIVPSREEVVRNPRSRSSKLRILEKR
ncbi:MAG: 16S rRNA (cytosine(1402)-N(4))-methyltransferase RsmH [Candidatus Pacebacteria bacterium]|nr:16S rRNA (cytosine(1402)-N(4))-methyltransferase RsmH [Candidatus Paceibacterota bacterium]MDD5356722.1 16S rRNA (cytosine(1402)-N(4))-methyltransferase RsmH [Candidatus Paceibacterota bacterium]